MRCKHLAGILQTQLRTQVGLASQQVNHVVLQTPFVAANDASWCPWGAPCHVSQDWGRPGQRGRPRADCWQLPGHQALLRKGSGNNQAWSKASGCTGLDPALLSPRKATRTCRSAQGASGSEPRQSRALPHGSDRPGLSCGLISVFLLISVQPEGPNPGFWPGPGLGYPAPYRAVTVQRDGVEEDAHCFMSCAFDSGRKNIQDAGEVPVGGHGPYRLEALGATPCAPNPSSSISQHRWVHTQWPPAPRMRSHNVVKGKRHAGILGHRGYECEARPDCSGDGRRLLDAGIFPRPLCAVFMSWGSHKGPRCLDTFLEGWVLGEMSSGGEI